MSTTRDYLEFLSQKIDIAPVNSEEEYQAAETIESLMQEHGLETRLQDFEAPGAGKLGYQVLGIVMFLGVFLAGLLGTGASALGILLVLASFVIYLLYFLGIFDLLGGIGPKVHSQNVIGVHRGTGPNVVKGTRPIVIVAHYDTPRESLLYREPLARVQSILRKFSPQAICAAAVLGLLQAFGFIPAGARHILWILAVLAALPMLVVGVSALYERFAPCTEGSNDNKSGIAALLGVMSMVHPGDDAATGFAEQRDRRDREAAERARIEAERRAAEEAAAAQAAAEAAAAAERAEAEAAAAAEQERQAAAAQIPEEDVAAESEGDEAGYAEQPDSEEQAEPVFEEEPAAQEVSPSQGEASNPEDEYEFAYQDNVVVYNDGPLTEEDLFEPSEPAPVEEPASEPVAQPQTRMVTRELVEVERVEGVRHGKEVLESLGILPDTCEVVYTEPRKVVRTVTEEVQVSEGPATEPAPVFETIHAPLGQDQQMGEQFEDAGYEEYAGEEESRVSEALSSFGTKAKGFFGRAKQAVSDRVEQLRERRAAQAELREQEAAEQETSDAAAYEDAYEDAPYEEEADFGDQPYEDEEPAYEEQQAYDDQAYDSDGYVEDEGYDAEPLEYGLDDASYADDTADVTATLPVENDQEANQDSFGEGEAETIRDTVYEVPTPISVADDDDGTLKFMPLDQLEDGQEVDSTDKDTTGLDMLATDETVVSSRQPDEVPQPKAPDDPEWGKSNFRPEVSTVARRAILFDLPDPMGSTAEEDPLADEPGDTARTSRSKMVAADAMRSRTKPGDAASQRPAGAASVGEPLPIGTIHASAPAEASQKTEKKRKRAFFGRKKNKKYKQHEQESMGEWLGVGDDYDAKTGGREIGSWDHFNDDEKNDKRGGNGSWKGGATQRSDLRVIEGAADDVRVQDDLREAVLRMGDDDLIAHDIWFVALGGSYADHAGMKAFLAENRRAVRGSFVVNLSCVGAGDLTILTSEGLVGTRRADRRMGRLLQHVADDLHISLGHAAHDWESTDATPAMQASMRAMTICGLTPEGAFALSQVPDDEPDAVDPAQTTATAQIVAEMIRRS